MKDYFEIIDITDEVNKNEESKKQLFRDFKNKKVQKNKNNFYHLMIYLILINQLIIYFILFWIINK